MTENPVLCVEVFWKNKYEPSLAFNNISVDMTLDQFIAHVQPRFNFDAEEKDFLILADPLDNKIINVDDLGDWYEVVGHEKFGLILRPASDLERAFKDAHCEYQNAKRLFEQREKQLEDLIYSTRSKKKKTIPELE